MGEKLPVQKKGKSISYAKWGYIFILPFFIAYAVFTLAPQILTIYYSFFEYREKGLSTVGPDYIGLANYAKLFEVSRNGDIKIVTYFFNTLILWVGGAVPQIVIALMLAVFFTSYRLNIKGQGFFKTVIYMPNLIMASAFSMLFFMLFSPVGPVNQLLTGWGILDKAFDFMNRTVSVRSLIMLMNFLMWFGNTTIVLMAGIMGIDQTYFEAAQIDGASAWSVFWKITMPLLMPIVVYVVLTAMIGGLQMFDVPQLLTNGRGTPNNTSTTLVMYLNQFLGTQKNYGMAGAISTLLFLISGALSLVVYRAMVKDD